MVSTVKLKKFCSYCAAELSEEPKVFSNGTKQIELRCTGCESFNGYQNQTPQSIVVDHFPGGKHANKKFEVVLQEDPQYILWAKQNFKSQRVREGIVEFLTSKGIDK